MKPGFYLTDYKIQSEGIYKFTLVVFLILLSAILVAEVFVDLRATSMEILLPSMAGLFTTVVCALRWPNAKAIRVIFITLLYMMVEAHFLYQPVIFHMIIFWFPFVPLIALIISGTRASLLWLTILLLTIPVNAYYLNATVGDSYTIEIFRLPVMISGVIFAIAVSANSLILYHLLGKAYQSSDNKKKELEKIKIKIERKRNLLESYMREFIRFSRDDANFNQGQEHLYESICNTLSAILNASRVSIWLFDDKKENLIRQFLCSENGELDDLKNLCATSFPIYFKALASEPYILASNARSYPFTKEFKEAYLEKLDIHSLLDCPIMVDRTPIGVICCEAQNKPRVWNIEDALFVQSITDFISMSFKNQRIERLMNELRKTNSELKVKNREIEIMNAALDNTVQKRTMALKSKSAQLTEYSFINSHLVRAPLTRILGLSQHLVDESTTIKEHELFDALIDSTHELDLILREINQLLSEGKGVTREDLISIEKEVKIKTR